MLYQGTHAPLQSGLICQLANRARSFSITLSNNATATSTAAVSLIFTTTIATIGANSITLSNNATATATAVSLKFGQDPNKYDLMDTAAHEIDEALGLGSAMDG